MRTKRGLSDVVTTVLIILLVLAAVVIIWTFVRPAIEGGISQVGSECFEMDLKVTDCEITPDINGDLTTGDPGAIVQVERGSADIDYESVVLVFSDDTDQSSVDSSTTTVIPSLSQEPSVLGREKYVVPDGAAGSGLTGAPTEVTVTARVRSEAGEVKLCNPTATKAACA